MTEPAWGRQTGVPGNRWDLLAGRTAEPLSVSVIVAHYSQPEQLARTLLSLRRQNYPADLIEIIVVDDGSPEPPQVDAGVALLIQPDLGFRLAAARNLGAAAARHDVLVFLDADTSPEPDYLRHLVRLPSLNWDAVTVGRRRHADFSGLPHDCALRDAGERHELTEPRWLLDGYRSTRDLLDADQHSYRYLIGAVLACTRRFFDETGGFDETFDRYGGEDWEWAYRAWLNGALFAHVPEAVAWHDGPEPAERGPIDLATKNDEAVRLAALIPVHGERGRAVISARADVIVDASLPDATAGQRFVSADSTLLALPGAVLALEGWGDDRRFDRVRIEVVLEQPVRADAGCFDEAVAALESDQAEQVDLVDADGTVLARLVSRRAARRGARWGDECRLPRLSLIARGLVRMHGEADVEGYLGGWA